MEFSGVWRIRSRDTCERKRKLLRWFLYHTTKSLDFPAINERSANGSMKNGKSRSGEIGKCCLVSLSCKAWRYGQAHIVIKSHGNATIIYLFSTLYIIHFSKIYNVKLRALLDISNVCIFTGNIEVIFTISTFCNSNISRFFSTDSFINSQTETNILIMT